MSTELQVLDRHVRGASPHDCPDTCTWTVTVRDGRAIELRADREHPRIDIRLRRLRR